MRGSFFPLHVGPQLILLRCYASSRGGATLSAYLPPFSRGKWIRRPKHAAELPAPRNGLRARVEVLCPVDLPLTPAGDAGCDGEISVFPFLCSLFSAHPLEGIPTKRPRLLISLFLLFKYQVDLITSPPFAPLEMRRSLKNELLAHYAFSLTTVSTGGFTACWAEDEESKGGKG